MPSVFVGVLFHCLRRDGRALLLSAAFLSVIGFGLQDAGLLGTLQLRYGAPLGAAAMLIVLPEAPFARRLGALSMDVYLVHILVLAVAYRASPFPPSTLAGGLLVCAASTAAAIALGRLRRLEGFLPARFV